MWAFGLKNKFKKTFEEVGSIKPFKTREIPPSLLNTVDKQKFSGIYSSKEQTESASIIKYNTIVEERNEYINFNAEGNKYFKDKYGYTAISSVYFCKYIYSNPVFSRSITPAEDKLSIPDNIIELVNNTKVLSEDTPCEIWGGNSQKGEYFAASWFESNPEKPIENAFSYFNSKIFVICEAKGGKFRPVKCYYIQKNNTAIGIIIPLYFKSKLFHAVVFP